MWSSKFTAFIAALLIIFISSLYMLSAPTMGHFLIILWLIAGSVMFFGGFLAFDALRTRRQYPIISTGGVAAIGGFIALIGFGIIWFVYFVDWD